MLPCSGVVESTSVGVLLLSDHVIAGMRNVKSGPHAGSYSGLYIPDCTERKAVL